MKSKKTIHQKKSRSSYRKELRQQKSDSHTMGKIEIRKKDGNLDEVILFNENEDCIFHLEQMGNKHWWMRIKSYDTNVDVNLKSVAEISATVHGWRNS